MLHVYEFEVFKDPDEGGYLAFPFDMDGGTQGDSIQEVSEMAADWLQTEIEHRAIHGIPLPNATFGNELKHGGERLLVSVSAGRDTVDAVSASEAANRLGVSPSRVSHMLRSGLLEGWREGRDTYVTLGSIEARLEEKPKAGRPRKVVTT